MSEKIQPVKTTLSIIDNLLKPQGFKFKKSLNTFLRANNDGGFDAISFRSLKYWPNYIFEFAFHKRIEIVENLTEKILERFEVKADSFLGSTIAWYYPEHRQVNACPPMRIYSDKYLEVRNTDFSETVSFVMSYINGKDNGFFERFGDIRQIDALINGPDFWVDDWLKPYHLGGGFRYKRLIIAYLCRNPRFEELLNFDYVGLYYQNNPEEDPSEYKGPERVNGQTAYEYLQELLKDVKPLF